MSTRVGSPAIYWPVDEVGSLTPGQLRLGFLSLVDYIACHLSVDLLWTKSTDVLSCTPSPEVMLN
jgi:hypothetical protein